MSHITELILYLEPSSASSLGTQLHAFFSATATQPYARNEATRYPPHATMVGFFNEPALSTHPITTTTSSVIEYIDTWHHSLLHPTTTTTTTTTTTRTASSIQESFSSKTHIDGLLSPKQTLLLIKLIPSPHLTDLIASLAKAYPDLGLRLKQINHISLCYWDDPSDATLDPSTGEQLELQRAEWTLQAAYLAQETIPLLRNNNSNNINDSNDTHTNNNYIQNGMDAEAELWDVVLYAITGRDKANGLPYPLQELKRWILPSFV